MLKTAQTKQGTVKGIPAADPRIISYKGIPYAAVPSGDLRWRAPAEYPRWEGERECYTFSPIPCQSKPGTGEPNIYDREWNVDTAIPMDEDCLTLNIWTPANSTEDNLPVYFWIYGGGLQWGNSAEMEFDGERIARRGIVVVTINYRLNVFGFFAHPQSDKNIGNLDQQFALRWVYENIRSFGGNPDHIVIGGQSAGGGSVISQLNCPENSRYIKGAVIESGYFKTPYTQHFSFPPEQAQKQSEDFLESLGVSSIDEARKLSWETVRDANDSFHRMWFSVKDGTFSTCSAEEGIRNRTFLDVPILHGWTDNEFFDELRASTTEEFIRKANETYGNRADEFLELMDTHKGIEAATANSRFNTVEAGNIFLNGLRKSAGYRTPTYIYEFGAYMPGGDEPGAFHSSDLWFFFETLAKCWRPFTGKDYDLSRKMCNYLCNFIKTLDPNGSDSNGEPMPEWKAYTEEIPAIMNFKTSPELEVRVPDRRMKFYHEWIAENN